MPTAPTPITALPTPPNPDSDEATFDSLAYPWTVALDPFTTQANALAANMYANAVGAATAAGTATTQAGIATTKAGEAAGSATAAAGSAGTATTQAGIATTQAGIATTKAGEAAGSAIAAASAAAGLLATSTSSLLIGLGAKSFTTQAGKQFSVGAWITAASAANPANYMYGQVTSYAGTALVLDVQSVGGSGTFADWALSVSGPRGNTGPIGPQGPAIDYAVLAESALIALPVTSGTSGIRHIINIDANRVALIFGSTAALQGIVYDRSTKLFGAGFLIRSAANLFSSAGLCATDKILVASVASGAAAFEAVVISFSGTAPTVNTAASGNTGENTTGIVMAPNAAVVGSTFVFGLQLASSNRVIAVTVSGNTPTIGTSIVPPASTPGGQITVRSIDSTRALATYLSSGPTMVFCPITVSAGTTLTAGTQASTAATNASFYGPYPLTTGRFAVAYSNTNSYGATVSISGTVASVTTALLNTSGVSSCVKIGDRLLVKSNNTVNALTDVSGTATAGTSVTINTTAQPAAYGPDYVAYSDGATPGGYYVVKLSGNNPVYSEYSACAPFAPGIATGTDEVLPRILNLNGKSASVASTHQFSLVFSATGIDPKLRQSSAEPLSTPMMQSASVGWCIGSTGGATNVKLTRVEMV